MIYFQDVRRAAHVTRWHMVRTQRAQNLAEHHFMVSFYANEMAQKIHPTISANERLNLLDYCLRHDFSELALGDVASHTKKHLDAACSGKNPLRALEDAIDPVTTKLKMRLKKTPLELIAKLADLADALVFIYHEGIGVRDSVRDSASRNETLQALCVVGVLTPTQCSLATDYLSAHKKAQDHGVVVFNNLYSQFLSTLKSASSQYPSLQWQKGLELLSELLEGQDGQIGMECVPSASNADEGCAVAVY